MSLWTLADIVLWIAVAAPYYLGALALLAIVLLARRAHRALVDASRRVCMHLQKSPLAEPDPLDDDVGDDDHQYADEHAEMWWRSAAVDAAPLIPTQPGPKDDTYRALEAMYARPARTEENQ